MSASISYFSHLDKLHSKESSWLIHLARIIGVSHHSHPTLLTHLSQPIFQVLGPKLHQSLQLPTYSSEMISVIPLTCKKHLKRSCQNREISSTLGPGEI